MLTQVRGRKVLDETYVQQYVRHMYDTWPILTKGEGGQGPSGSPWFLQLWHKCVEIYI
jgi:hypothetical protein